MPGLQQPLCVLAKQQARPRALERRLSPGYALARTFMMLAPVASALVLSDCSAAHVDSEAYAVSAVEPAPRDTNVSARRRHALLAPQAPPDCEYKGSDADAVDRDLWERVKLDYQQHCYQHAEALVRNRLHQLQMSGVCEIRVEHHSRFVRRAPPS